MALAARWRRAGLVLPTLLALLGLAVLVGLGSWQMSRKAWKEGLLVRIATRIHAEPLPLAEALRRLHTTGDVEYLHVSMEGRFHHARERHVFTVDDRLGPGYHVFTPLRIEAEARFVLVNRGFVPAPLKDPAARAAGQVSGPVQVTGLVRMPVARGQFLPASEPERNMFYWPDYATMLGSVRRDGLEALEALPFFVDSDARPPNPGGLPKGGTTRLDLPNRHLEYALTWYGLALTLLGVFAAFAAARLRQVP